MKACTRPAHRGTRTLAALHATAGLWRAPTNVYTPIAVFAGLGNADGLPAPLQILTESAPNPAVDALFLFSRTVVTETTLRETAKTVAFLPPPHLPPPPGGAGGSANVGCLGRR